MSGKYEKEIITSKRFGEKYTHVKHPSGLDIFIWKLKGFSTVDAHFGTKYGSINTRFKTADDEDFVDVPEGIAHFLEHKLFENEDCNVFDLYAKTGAMANAFTSFDMTVYLYRCSDKYLESLEILLSFVQKPYFTQETVDKEQGIIGQEIKMCQDSPDRRCYFNLLRCLYKNHPVNIDIAGTVDSIAKIDADLLYRCYYTFYNLRNMALCIAGDVDEDEILRVCDEQLIPSKDIKLQTAFPDEPEVVAEKEIVEKMSVATPIFNIGIKFPPFSGKELVKKYWEAEIAAAMLVGSSSDLYREMTEEGLINSQFSFEVFFVEGVFNFSCSGESEAPHKVMDRIMSKIEELKTVGFDRKMFEMLKKSKYGAMIRDFDNSEACVSLLMNSYLNGTDVFYFIDAVADISFDDVTETFRQLFDPEKAAISIIEPNK